MAIYEISTIYNESKSRKDFARRIDNYVLVGDILYLHHFLRNPDMRYDYLPSRLLYSLSDDSGTWVLDYTRPSFSEIVQECVNLSELCMELNTHKIDYRDILPSVFPVFTRERIHETEEPGKTIGVYSWDKDRYLILSRRDGWQLLHRTPGKDPCPMCGKKGDA